jgi:hypothetical protein
MIGMAEWLVAVSVVDDCVARRGNRTLTSRLSGEGQARQPKEEIT